MRTPGTSYGIAALPLIVLSLSLSLLLGADARAQSGASCPSPAQRNARLLDGAAEADLRLAELLETMIRTCGPAGEAALCSEAKASCARWVQEDARLPHQHSEEHLRAQMAAPFDGQRFELGSELSGPSSHAAVTCSSPEGWAAIAAERRAAAERHRRIVVEYDRFGRWAKDVEAACLARAKTSPGLEVQTASATSQAAPVVVAAPVAQVVQVAAVTRKEVGEKDDAQQGAAQTAQVQKKADAKVEETSEAAAKAKKEDEAAQKARVMAEAQAREAERVKARAQADAEDAKEEADEAEEEAARARERAAKAAAEAEAAKQAEALKAKEAAEAKRKAEEEQKAAELSKAQSAVAAERAAREKEAKEAAKREKKAAEAKAREERKRQAEAQLAREIAQAKEEAKQREAQARKDEAARREKFEKEHRARIETDAAERRKDRATIARERAEAVEEYETERARLIKRGGENSKLGALEQEHRQELARIDAREKDVAAQEKQDAQAAEKRLSAEASRRKKSEGVIAKAGVYRHPRARSAGAIGLGVAMDTEDLVGIGRLGASLSGRYALWLEPPAEGLSSGLELLAHAQGFPGGALFGGAADGEAGADPGVERLLRAGADLRFWKSRIAAGAAVDYRLRSPTAEAVASTSVLRAGPTVAYALVDSYTTRAIVSARWLPLLGGGLNAGTADAELAWRFLYANVHVGVMPRPNAPTVTDVIAGAAAGVRLYW